MARHSGKNGVVKLGGDAVVALTGWDIEESVSTTETTACGDTSKQHDSLIPGWSGSIKMNADHGADGHNLRAGASLAFEGYTEGDASGKTYYSGTITLTSSGVDSPYDGTVTTSYSFEGNGDLDIATVS
jgi:hypothetical protein